MNLTRYKIVLVNAIALLVTPITLAAHNQQSSLGSLQGLIATFGLESGNITHNIGIAATFGLLWFSIYIILKKLVVKFELQELFNLESGSINQDSSQKNLVAVLALLLVISMMGAGHWIEPIGLIWDIQQLIILAVVFGVIALAITVIGGGTAGVAWTAGQTGQAINQGVQELEQARQDLSNIGGGGNNNGPGNSPSNQARDLEAAVDEIENGFSDVETPLHHAENDLMSDIQDINDALNDPKSARGSNANYRNLEDKIKHFKKAIELTRSQAHNPGYSESDIKNGNGNFQHNSSMIDSLGLPSKYQTFGLLQAKSEANEIKEAAKRLDKKEEHAASILDDELNSLIEDARNLAKATTALKKMLQELKTVQDKDKMIKDAAQEIEDRSLFDQARTIGQHEQYLENKLDPILNNELPNMKSNLQDARQRLKSELSMSASTITSLETILNNGDIENELNDIRSGVSSELGSVPSDVDNLLNQIQSDSSETWNYLRAMYQADRHEVDDEEKIIKEIDNAIDAIDEVINT